MTNSDNFAILQRLVREGQDAVCHQTNLVAQLVRDGLSYDTAMSTLHLAKSALAAQRGHLAALDPTRLVEGNCHD